MSLPYQNKLIPRAKELRKGATKQEKHLWYDFLRSYPVRFQRQKAIDHFIADFYCHAAKLIIELDGAQHYDEQGLARDKERTAILSEYGVEVLRFSNTEVENDFCRVCTVIDSAVNKRMRAFACLWLSCRPPPVSRSPRCAGGTPASACGSGVPVRERRS